MVIKVRPLSSPPARLSSLTARPDTLPSSPCARTQLYSIAGQPCVKISDELTKVRRLRSLSSRARRRRRRRSRSSAVALCGCDRVDAHALHLARARRTRATPRRSRSSSSGSASRRTAASRPSGARPSEPCSLSLSPSPSSCLPLLVARRSTRAPRCVSVPLVPLSLSSKARAACK